MNQGRESAHETGSPSLIVTRLSLVIGSVKRKWVFHVIDFTYKCVRGSEQIRLFSPVESQERSFLFLEENKQTNKKMSTLWRDLICWETIVRANEGSPWERAAHVI